MRPRNIIAVFQGDAAAEAAGADVDKRFKVLKKHEIRNLGSFCTIMKQNGCSMAHFDGFFVSYSIAQIGKEFDLLRFGNDCILNIEIDYFDNSESVKDYMAFLRESGWTAITYTTSTYDPDPYDELTELGDYNAHGVIGQEFSKVVFVMDKNFRYS